jgi:hypothetical protein
MKLCPVDFAAEKPNLLQVEISGQPFVLRVFSATPLTMVTLFGWRVAVTLGHDVLLPPAP